MIQDGYVICTTSDTAANVAFFRRRLNIRQASAAVGSSTASSSTSHCMYERTLRHKGRSTVLCCDDWESFEPIDRITIDAACLTNRCIYHGVSNM